MAPTPQSTPDDSPHHDVVVVGLGGSAGGVEALKAFFAALPEADGMAFVVILHLAPDEESRLSAILQADLPLPVTQVTEPVTIEAGHVYVIPPTKNLLAAGHRLVLEPIEEERIARRPIDHFFRTLAEAYGPRAVGVLLSGTGANGTVGVGAIKEAGGLILAQDPDEAAFDEMPRTAIASGVVDAVGSASALAVEAVAYARRVRGAPLPDAPSALATDSAKALTSVLAHLHARTGHDFAHYKRSTVLRRLGRRLHATGSDSLVSYLDLLRESATEADALLNDLLISVTNFFRDPDTFQALEAAVPRLFAGKGEGDEVRVWVAGCATGEEAYSVAMLLLEHAAALAAPPRVQVFATDISDAAVRTARAGAYPESIEADVSSERLERFFSRENGRYRVGEALREAVLCAQHSLLVNPPFSRLDLVACRNVLIYFQRDLQQQALAVFHYALRPGGLLLLGTSESPGDGPERFGVVDKAARLYHRQGVDTPAPPLLSRLPRVLHGSRAGDSGAESRQPAATRETTDAERAHLALRSDAAAPSVLVGDGGDVLHVSDGAAPFLQVTTGTPTRALGRVLRPELRASATTALFKARREQQPVETVPVAIELDGATRSVVVRARPAPDGAVVQVSFELSPTNAAAVSEADDVLAEALRQTQEQLQVSVEEFETSREELRAQNEELQSINEELRSTAEELETAEEEAQSMSEELRAVNDELKHKVDETARAKGDLENLIVSTEIATLFLDRDLCIQRFTPHVRDLFYVRASDVGRPLSDLAHTFGDARLVEDAEAVLLRLDVKERELEGEDGRWFLVHTRPYRTLQGRIDGVVVTFVDITRRKTDEEALRQSKERLHRVAQTVPDVLFRATPGGRIEFVNQRFQALTGRPAHAVAGGAPWDDLVPESDREPMNAAWTLALESGEPFESRHRLRTADGARWVITRARLASAEPSEPEPGPPAAARELQAEWIGSITDIDALVRSESRVRRLNETLEASIATRTEQVHKLSARLAHAEHEERRRIALVLHDDLQQQLTGLAMILHVLWQSPATDAHRAFQSQADRILTDATALTRSLSTEMSPPVLSSDDFGEVVRWLAASTSDKFQMEVAVEVQGRCDVPDDGVRTLLYQTLRELLFNVVKHAGTTRASVRVHRDGGAIVATVEDHGDGFDADAAAAGGFGLFSVRERIEMIGGQVEVDSEPGRGTTVMISVPVDKPAAEQTR